MHRNKPNITYLLTAILLVLGHWSMYFWRTRRLILIKFCWQHQTSPYLFTGETFSDQRKPTGKWWFTTATNIWSPELQWLIARSRTPPGMIFFWSIGTFWPRKGACLKLSSDFCGCGWPSTLMWKIQNKCRVPHMLFHTILRRKYWCVNMKSLILILMLPEPKYQNLVWCRSIVLELI